LRARLKLLALATQADLFPGLSQLHLFAIYFFSQPFISNQATGKIGGGDRGRREEARDSRGVVDGYWNMENQIGYSAVFPSVQSVRLSPRTGRTPSLRPLDGTDTQLQSVQTFGRDGRPGPIGVLVYVSFSNFMSIMSVLLRSETFLF